MRKILLLLIIFSTFGCKSDKRETISKSLDTELHLVEFLETEIHFPKNYEKSSLEEVTEIFEQTPRPNGYEVAFINALQNLKDFNADYEVFSDKQNYMNSIWFTLGEYIPLDKSIVNTYVNMLEQQILPQSKKLGIKYKRIESKFLTNKNAKAIKIKYVQMLDGNKRYLTQYLVTYNLKTFSFIVSNNENVDYQFMISNFGAY